MALGFVSVSISLQLEKEWITIGWALEGVAVIYPWTVSIMRGSSGSASRCSRPRRGASSPTRRFRLLPALGLACGELASLHLPRPRGRAPRRRDAARAAGDPARDGEDKTHKRGIRPDLPLIASTTPPVAP